METVSEQKGQMGAWEDHGPNPALKGVREAGNLAAVCVCQSEKASLPRPSRGLLETLAETPRPKKKNCMKERKMGVVAGEIPRPHRPL